MIFKQVFKSLLIIVTVLVGVIYDSRIQAQITPDESLGEDSSVVTPDVEVKGKTADRIDGGAIRDRNLFHSFSQFNVGESENVYFANPDNIDQIFTRVTGGDPSDILGTLGVDGAADRSIITQS
jgi:filamentous hemagglutinin family protein